MFFIILHHYADIVGSKHTPKILVAKSKRYMQHGGENVKIPEKTPWEAKGWSRQEWLSWHQKRQSTTSSDRATLNPSW